MAKENKAKGLWTEFKAFISRGNVLDMAVGVIIGGAFNAIVTAFTNILLSLCTWAVPGGLKGLVTVLPALNDAQRGLDGIGQKFAAADIQTYAYNIAEANYASTAADAGMTTKEYLTANPNLIEAAKSFITSKYTLHGTTYTYNLSAVIDWGTFINAIISFLIVALTLFIVVKVAATVSKKRLEMQEKAKAALAKKEEPAAE